MTLSDKGQFQEEKDDKLKVRLSFVQHGQQDYGCGLMHEVILTTFSVLNKHIIVALHNYQLKLSGDCSE